MIPIELLTVLLTGGLGAMVLAGVQAWRTIREGAKADDKDAYLDLESKRVSEKRRADRAEQERDHWRTWAGTLEYVILTNLGPEALPPRQPLPADDPVPAGES